MNSFESHLCEVMWRNWTDSRRLSAILELTTRHYPLNMPVQFSATFPVFATWFMRQEPSADVSMQRLDSSEDDQESDYAES